MARESASSVASKLIFNVPKEFNKRITTTIMCGRKKVKINHNFWGPIISVNDNALLLMNPE